MKDERNLLGFFLYYNFNLLQKKKRRSLKFRMGISWFSEFYPLLASSPLLIFKMIFLEFVVNYKDVDLQVLFLWLQESGQSNICVRSYDKNTEIVQDVSISIFFQF